MYLFSEPACYINHSFDPNTTQDIENMCDRAIKRIKKGEMITTNATKEIQNELETFIEVYEKSKNFLDFEWIKVGYRNAIIRYTIKDKCKELIMKRIEGNWTVFEEKILL